MTTDAGFRVCCTTLSNLLQTVNGSILTITTDTGQINLATVTKPGASNTKAGYQIYKFTDSIGTLYIRIDYGTGGSATIFSTWITVGTGTDGAGTITGTLSSVTQSAASAAPASTSTNYASYACCVNGAVWFLCAVGSNSNAAGTRQSFWGMARTCDSTGALTSDGYESFSVSNTAPTVFCVNLSTSNVFSSTNCGHCLLPYGITSSNYGTGGNNIYQVWRHELPMPQTLTTALAGSHLISEVGAATTTSMALVGSTSHTFFFTGAAMAYSATTGATAGSVLCGWVLVYE